MLNLKPVLYAEDDENDIFFMQRAFAKLKIPNPLRTVTDGKLAVAYLAGTAPFQNREENPLPCLVLLDLSMPGKHGLDVLKWLHETPSLAGVPSVVMSSSNQESDIHRANQLGASGFLIKPGDPEDLLRIVKGVAEYWLGETRPNGSFVEFAKGGTVVPVRSVAT